MASIGLMTFRLSIADLGVTAEHLIAMDKAIDLAPESYGIGAYGITEDEREKVEVLLAALSLSLPESEREKWDAHRGAY